MFVAAAIAMILLAFALPLAHVNSDRVEAAYMRTDLFARRRGLMQSWADYVSKGDLDG